VENVGTYSGGVSPFGAVDMVGNAWEWTASDFVAYPGGRLSGQATAMLKVIRGGCFLSRPDQATVTIRVGWPARGGDEYDNTGFRCAKDLGATSQSVEAQKVVVTPTPVELVVNPQPMEGSLGQVTFSQQGKTLFYFERKSKRGKIVINGSGYVLTKLSYSNNGAYKLSGEEVTIDTSKAKWNADEGADCAYGGVSTVNIVLNGVSTTIRNVKLQDCPDPDD
jgi:hypothetical protein